MFATSIGKDVPERLVLLVGQIEEPLVDLDELDLTILLNLDKVVRERFGDTVGFLGKEDGIPTGVLSREVPADEEEDGRETEVAGEHYRPGNDIDLLCPLVSSAVQAGETNGSELGLPNLRADNVPDAVADEVHRLRRRALRVPRCRYLQPREGDDEARCPYAREEDGDLWFPRQLT